MEINLHNYEAFFLDYKEGNLSSQQEKELFLFLERHPHLYEELNNYEDVVLEKFGVKENFANKNILKKIDYTNDNLIAYTEDLLDEKNKNEIDILALQNSAFKKELEFYKSTRIQPDLSEKFKNKAQLKRGGLIISLQNNYNFLRVAAAVLLLTGLFFLIAKLNTKEDVTKNKTEVADAGKEVVGGRKKAKINSRQSAVGSQESKIKNLASSENSNSVKQQNPKYKTRNNNTPQPEIKNVATNTVETNNPIANNTIKNNQKDSVQDKIIIVENNNTLQNQNTNKSYFNYSADKEDEAPVTASVTPAKKSFFQKLVKVAKNVNDFGIKKVNASEENNSNSLSIGSFVVSETSSN